MISAAQYSYHNDGPARRRASAAPSTKRRCRLLVRCVAACALTTFIINKLFAVFYICLVRSDYDAALGPSVGAGADVAQEA